MVKQKILKIYVHEAKYDTEQGGSQGEGGKSPGNRKKLLQKTGVLSVGSKLVTNFRKKIKNKNKAIQFYRIFIEEFPNFLKISQQFVFFVQTPKKVTHSLLNYQKKCENNAFLANFPRRLFNIFEKFLKISKKL